MLCPKCRSVQLRCVDSRPVKDTVKRRRHCLKCGYRFSTVEVHAAAFEKMQREALQNKSNIGG